MAAGTSPGIYNLHAEEHLAVNWVGLEKVGEIRIVIALALALRSKSISEIARETGIPTSSLYSIRKYGPYAHKNKQSRVAEKHV
jgi:hypothetical protein